jgi:hypothetical protein
MMKKTIAVIALVLVLGVVVFLVRNIVSKNPKEQLFSELEPVKLENCSMKRFGHPNDGGYVMCANLLDRAQVAYSYGIGGRDEWGCDISSQYHLTVHQYDCFNIKRPSCPQGNFIFHEECVGDKANRIENRIYDSVESQIAGNGDLGKTLVVKMDVEGSEWDSLLSAPDPVLNAMDQFVVEFHIDDKKPDETKYLQVIRKLKKNFHIANVHFNNNSCTDAYKPFPSWVFEILFVNKKIGKLGEGTTKQTGLNPLDTPNNTSIKDCQAQW